MTDMSSEIGGSSVALALDLIRGRGLGFGMLELFSDCVAILGDRRMPSVSTNGELIKSLYQRRHYSMTQQIWVLEYCIL
jgi:hypothetical protein